MFMMDRRGGTTAPRVERLLVDLGEELVVAEEGEFLLTDLKGGAAELLVYESVVVFRQKVMLVFVQEGCWVARAVASVPKDG